MANVRIGERVVDPEMLRLTPRMDEPAPEFDVQTTHGRRKLSDYRGRWLVLFAHPADFTPVCTTEMIALAQAYPQLQELKCDVLGLSVDSRFSHMAWMQNIREKFGVEIPFPVIEDVSMWIASVYGMIQPGSSETTTVRATFIIDPQGILRVMLYYPIAVGRSVAELVRIIRAMQVVEQHKVSTPEGWQPGEKVILPVPATAEELAQRARNGADYVDWYFCRKQL